MKNLRTIACCFSFSLFAFAASAQQQDIPLNQPDLSKPDLFSQAPEKVALESSQIAVLLSASVGEPVVISLPSFRFEGTVISTVSKYASSIESVVIRSSNYHGATLTLTRITEPSGNISYTGRILSMNHGDLYQLKQVNNELLLVKNKFYSLVNE
jgi:hypothetical protein